ncbi:unnamed protein product [Ilex paraguariensis]|uniref:Uncharacterized protein n=1 Tax=Ilex paraguariensis TaxID=185542 RepID=A0ABC8QV65_9AQUA
MKKRKKKVGDRALLSVCVSQTVPSEQVVVAQSHNDLTEEFVTMDLFITRFSTLSMPCGSQSTILLKEHESTKVVEQGNKILNESNEHAPTVRGLEEVPPRRRNMVTHG